MTKKIICMLLAAIMLLSFTACKKEEATGDDTTIAETKPEKETAKETEVQTEAETEPVVVEPDFINPLTGLETSVDLSARRPVSVMVNNIGVSLPQSGISYADIIFECLAEGGITRLMMISTEYENLPKIGSVRSARDYYIDYAESYDCIFMHAGGSTYAYDTIATRNTDNIDGVNGPSIAGTYLRDQDRLNAGYAFEHTLFLQGGAAIQNAISGLGYRATRAEGYETPVTFAKWGETVELDKKATHIGVNVSNYQYVDYVYDEESGKYLRYQYNGQPHIDYSNNEQLAFENVIIIYNDCGAISGDAKNRIWMQTTGEGNAYYITNGTYTTITWKKENHNSLLKFYYADGTEVELNRGKTMINVVPNTNRDFTVFDDETSKFTPANAE